MAPEVYAEFERLIRTTGRIWHKVLEIGPHWNAPESLLTSKLVKGATRAGVDLEGGYTIDGVTIDRASARQLPYEDGSFDLVLCNSVLEHEPRFWEVLQEIRRVLVRGGVFVCGTPGYPTVPRTPSTVVGFHQYPDDYYRFSASAFRQVIFDGFTDVVVNEIMEPVRVVGMGTRL